jgi:hypothetical protein
LGGWGSVVGNPILVPCAILDEKPVVQRARYAGVVQWPVVLKARRAERERVLGVVLIKARCAGVILCWCGAVMPPAGERLSPARPTRRSSRPLRAQDRWYFSSLCSARGS